MELVSYFSDSNLKLGFEDHSKYFIYSEEKSNFNEHVEMGNVKMEVTMTLIHREDNHTSSKINLLWEVEILKAASSP